MQKNNDLSFGNGLLAALKVGTANAVSVVTRPVYTAQVILGIKEGPNVSEMLEKEVVRQKQSVHSVR